VGVPDAAALASDDLMDGGAEARHQLEAEELGIIKFVGARRLFYCQRVLTLSSMESSENTARAGSAYRGKAAIFRTMESTMAYRGFLPPGRSALLKSASATVVGLIVDLPR
jgi:hypothetical protein